MMGVTAKQAELLAWLRVYGRTHNHGPSYEEIARGIGVASKGGVHRLVKGLVGRGRIRRIPGAARSIEVLEEGESPAYFQPPREQVFDIPPMVEVTVQAAPVVNGKIGEWRPVRILAPSVPLR